MSPAPIRIPSSAKTTAAGGHITQNSGHIALAWSRTSWSEVKAFGSTPLSTKSISPMATPAASDHSIIRQAAARAPAAALAPSARPTSTWPAIAIASSVSARNPKSWKAIWWAASDGAPTRARTALASTKQASSEAVRTKICAPIVVSGRIDDQRGRRSAAGARTNRAANAAPMPS